MWFKRLALLLACCSLLLPSATGQRKELVQLQRDMALLQDVLRQLEEKTSDRLVGVEALVRQVTEQQDTVTAGLAVIERGVAALDDGLTEPQRSTAARVDALTTQFAILRATVEEIGVTVDRLHADVRDIKTHLTTIPGPGSAEGEIRADETASNAGDAIFEGGMSDYMRGNIENARLQFMDYLALHPNQSKAGDAQFYLAETYYSAADYDEAARQFDQVYRRYPLSKLAPDAIYKLGLSLVKLRRNDEAAKSFQSVLDRFPSSNVAPHARTELNSLKNAKPSPGL